MSSDKKKEDRQVPRSGAVVPEDSTTGELATWLHTLWARQNPPERIEVWQVFNPHKSVRGERIYGEDFKPHDKRDIEQCTKLANEIVGTAQGDCDSVRRQQDYQIAVLDHYRAAGPTVRRLGPLFPKITYLAQQKGRDASPDVGDDDFEQPHNWRALQLKEIELSHERIRFGEQRNDAVLGDLLRGYRDTVLEQRTWLSDLMTKQMQFFRELQIAKNEEVDRLIVRKRAEMTVAVMEEGMKVVRTLLPMLFKDSQPAALAGATRSPDSSKPALRDYGLSEERSHVTNFLEDCEKGKLSEALFGDWEVKDEQPVHVGGGIFQPPQFLVLYGVSTGRLPASALDALMPDSGHKLALTADQMKKAEKLLPETMTMSIAYILGLREVARKKAASSASAAEAERVPV